MTKIKTLLIAIILLFSVGLGSKTVESEWFLKLSKLIDRIETRESGIRIDLVKYHSALLELGEIKQAFNLFNRPGLEEEKEELLEFILKSSYLKNNLNSKTLKSILYEIRHVNSPMGKCDLLIKLGYLFLDIDEKEELKKLLDIAFKRTMEIEFDCTNQAYYLGHIYKIYKLMKLEKESNQVFETMMSYYTNCEEAKYNQLYEYVIFFTYAKRFIEIGDYAGAKIFLEKVTRSIRKDDYFAYAANMIEVADMYFEIGEKTKTMEILGQVFDFCFCGKVKKSNRTIACLKELNGVVEYYVLFQKVDITSFIGNLEKIMQNSKGKELGNEIKKLLIRIYIHLHKYEDAFRRAQEIHEKEPDDEKSMYIFTIAKDMIDNGYELSIEPVIDQIESKYFKIALYHEAGKYLVESGKYPEAVKVLNKAFVLLKEYRLMI